MMNIEIFVLCQFFNRGYRLTGILRQRGNYTKLDLVYIGQGQFVSIRSQTLPNMYHDELYMMKIDIFINFYASSLIGATGLQDFCDNMGPIPSLTLFI